MAENYKVFDDGTWSLFTEGINDLSQKANNAIQGVKQNGTELTPDENGVINIELSMDEDLITIDDIDAICGASIEGVTASEVEF